MRSGSAPLAAALALCVAGCGSGGAGQPSRPAPPARPLHLRPDQRPTPIGVGPRYTIGAVSDAVAHRDVIAGERCVTNSSLPAVYGVHLELFARRRVLLVPAGVGVAPPQRRRGAYVLGGACVYRLHTLEPTGVVRVTRPRGRDQRTPTLGDLFAIWGQPLTPTRLTDFPGRVVAFVDGRRWHGSPRAIPLRRHAEIVLEVGGLIPPHPTYRFPPGL